MQKLIISLFISCLFGLTVYSQDRVVKVSSIHFNKDIEKKIILINKDVEVINTIFPNNKQSILSNDSTYTFNDTVSKLEIGKAYSVKDSNGDDYEMYFTQLPIINIYTNESIVDEHRIFGNFTLCEKNSNFIESSIGVEYRGGWTQTLPKKSMRIEFWNDMLGDQTKNLSLLGMRSDDDWNIQAMYNEPLRIRSKLNFELWSSIDELYYSEDEPEAINGVRQKYVELFLNKKYSGLYTLSEKLDRKQLKLKKFKDGQIRGELYKGIGWGASTFTSLPHYNNSSYYWSGFEYKHPINQINWTNISDFVDFVINEDDDDFYKNYKSQFKIDNAVNYFIFINLLRATDNTGKNTYIGKYNTDEPYFYIPWDLDGTLGVIFDGTHENITNDILTNGFYNRLILDQIEFGFADQLKKRWNELRKEIITVENLMTKFNNYYKYLESNGVYARELRAWPDSDDFLDINNLEYTSDWLKHRINYLESVFNNPHLLGEIDNFNPTKENQIKIFPNPASTFINIKVFETNLVLKNISLFNYLGKSLMQFGKEKTFKIDLSDLPNGLYFITVDFEDGSKRTEKVVIKK